MTTTFYDSKALQHLERAIVRADIVRRDTSKRMSTKIHEVIDITKWPKWLVELNTRLFNAQIGVKDEELASLVFALDLFEKISHPVDIDKARDLFLLSRVGVGNYSILKILQTIPDDKSEQIVTIKQVCDLLLHRLAGKDITKEIEIIITNIDITNNRNIVNVLTTASVFAINTSDNYAIVDTIADTAAVIASITDNPHGITRDAFNSVVRADLIQALKNAAIRD